MTVLPEPGFRRTWKDLCPVRDEIDPLVEHLAEALQAPQWQALYDASERAGTYPDELVRRLKELGLMRLFAGDGQGAEPNVYDLFALNSVTGQMGASLGVAIGVNALALLPVYLGASSAQCDALLTRVRSGDFSSMLLTELAHGSNLSRNEAFAERGTLLPDGSFAPVAAGDAATHYRLIGEKQLINGGQRHELLIALLRTRVSDSEQEASMLGAARDFTFLHVGRQQGVEALPAWQTLPAPGADISGVRFAQAVVPAGQVIGAEGEGLALVQRTLALSRGGVSALAAALASRSANLALAYAQHRNVYGVPIIQHQAIADHLLRQEALELGAACVSVKAAALLNAYGSAAAQAGAVAKLLACEWAEECAQEGGRVLGARALVEDFRYARLLRDSLLYGVFDGTSHVLLEQLQWRLSQSSATRNPPKEDSLELLGRAYRLSKRPVRELGQLKGRPLAIDLAAHARALSTTESTVAGAPVAVLAESLMKLVGVARASGQWTSDQGLRFDAARLMAEVEALLAMAELACPRLRDGLGMPALARDVPVAFAHGWLGARTAARLRALWLRIGSEAPATELGEAERALVEEQVAGRRARMSELSVNLGEVSHVK